MDTVALAALLFSHITASPADMEARFPRRTLPDGARVTRIAPSPTGFLHIGALFSALTDERLAHLSGGVFYLRIEDTDRKREVPGAVEAYIRNFARYGLTFDEGVTIDGDTGSYGPYRQSQRTEIYQTFAKWLVEQGRAYPCFCTEDELNAFCMELPRYKRPRKIIFADIPRNPTGKIEKPKLREMFGASRLVAKETELAQPDKE